MTTAISEPVKTTTGAVIETLTVDQYHEMLRLGILREGSPIELIDGVVVRKDRRDRGSPHMAGPRHTSSISQLDYILRDVEPHGFHCRNQSATTLAVKQEPEPDLSVVRGRRRDFFARHPRPDEILAAMEVSDSSLSYDRSTKQRIYASAGIPIYWIVNLVDNLLEVYTQPLPAEERYAQKTVYHSGQAAVLELAPGVVVNVAVAELFPPEIEVKAS